jgi:hypothetical protein
MIHISRLRSAHNAPRVRQQERTTVTPPLRAVIELVGGGSAMPVVRRHLPCTMSAALVPAGYG